MTEFIEAGDFSVDAESRTVRGLLLPWNELSRVSSSKTAPIRFERGTVTIPTDVSIVSANRNHDKYDPVGRAVSIEDTEKGLVAEFSIARTAEGDEFLEQHKTGAIRKLSAEIAGITRNGERAVAARLTGAAFVSQGAFESAALFALGDVTEEPVADTEDPTQLAVTEIQARIDALTEELAKRADETPEDNQSEVTPAEFSAEPVKEELMADATVPTGDGAKAEFSANTVFDLIANARKGDSAADFALADIKTSGTGALTTNGVLQPSWLGEIWAGRSYQRRYMPLVKNGSISSMEEKGYVITGGDDIVKEYSGNKADVPTGTGSTSLVTSDFQRWAGAVDIAREFYDIPGNREVIEAFIRRVVNGYAKKTDLWTLGKLIAAGEANRQVQETAPAGYDQFLANLIDGIELVNDSDTQASFVVASADVYHTLLRTPKDKLPEFVTFSFGTAGEGTADSVRVVKDRSGLLGAGDVLVGSAEGAHVNELGGGAPLVVDALDLARGGVDKAVHGYTQYLTEYPEAFVIVGAANS